MKTKEEANNYRTTARVVGVIYLAGFVVGIGGEILINSILGAPNHLSTISANSMMLAIGAILWLLAVAGDAAHGVLMFPLLKQHSERMAIGYLTARIVDAVFIAVKVLFILLQIPLASEYLKAAAPDAAFLQALSAVSAQVSQYGYEIGMSALGLAGLVLCYTLAKANLVPRFIAVWGLIGYAIMLGGSLLQILGFNLQSIHALPGGLWEVFVGVWLIVKGFNAAAFKPQTTRISKSVEALVTLSEPANS